MKICVCQTLRGILVYFLFLTQLTQSLSQELYYSTLNGRSIGIVDLNTCIAKDICAYPDIGFGFNDVAFHPDGSIYIVSPISELYKINREDCSIEFVTRFGNVTGLIIDHEGVAYAAGDKLFSYNTTTGVFRDHGFFANLRCGGDLAFYNGKLIMSASDRNTTQNESGLYTIDIENPINSSLILSLYDFYFRDSFHGLTSKEISCGISQLFGTGWKSINNPLQVINRGIASIDLEMGTVDWICELEIFSGATHPLEYLGSETNCELLLDLDRDNSSGEYPYDFRNTSILCTTDKTATICDDDVVVFTEDARVDSIVLHIQGVGDPGSESLILTAGYTSATLTPTGTPAFPSYTLHTIGDPGDENTMEALRNVRYHHSGQRPSSGIRTVQVQAFNAVRTSEAFAYIHVDAQPNSGRDTTFILCSHIQYVNLSNIIGGDPDGRWEPPFVSGEDIYFSEDDRETTYLYITETEECADTARVSFNRVVDRQVDLGDDGELCRGESLVLQIATLPGDGIEWDDGSMETEREITGPGDYSVMLTTVEGCVLTGAIAFAPVYIDSSRTERVCHGETFQYGGIDYYPGDVIQDTITGETSCDTILSLIIESYDIPVMIRDTMVCFNPVLDISGEDYMPGDTIRRWLTAEEGCDTLLQTVYRMHETDSLEVDISAGIVCPGDSSLVQVYPEEGLEWSHGGENPTMILPPGSYTVMYSDEEGCVQEYAFEIEEAIPVSYTTEWMDPECMQGNGVISVIPEGGMAGLSIEIGGEERMDGMATGLEGGMYSIRLTDSLGCEQLDEIVLYDTLSLEVMMAASVEVILGNRVSVPFTALGGIVGEVNFTPGEDIERQGETLLVTGVRDRDYTIEFRTEEGCSDVRLLEVKVIIPDDIIVLPNVVRMNAMESDNGKFYLKAVGLRYDMQIYDRWGNMVYARRNMEGGDEDQAWEPSRFRITGGVYVYKIQVYTETGELTRTGTVTVVE